MSDLISEFESPKKKIKRETNSDENINVEEFQVCDMNMKHFDEKLRNNEQPNFTTKTIENLEESNYEIKRIKGSLCMESNDQLSVIKEELEQSISSKEEKVSEKLGMQIETMRNDLKCGICGEEFHEATTLNCSHTFCKFCISMWKTKNAFCPICRTPVTSECRSLVIDSFVENILQTQSEDVKKKRKERLKAREDNKLELVRELSKVNVDDDDLNEDESDTTVTTNVLREEGATEFAEAADATEINANIVQATPADTNNGTIWSSLRWLWRGRNQNP